MYYITAGDNIGETVGVAYAPYIIGAIVGGHSWSSSQVGNGEETLDTSLSKRVLQLVQVIDYRLTQ
jgi:hypothetical protein